VTVPGDPPGQVVGQAPSADTAVPSGSRVTVQVRRVPVQVRVPDLIGSTEDGVCQRLYAAKLTCAPAIGGAGVTPGRVVGLISLPTPLAWSRTGAVPRSSPRPGLRFNQVRSFAASASFRVRALLHRARALSDQAR